MIDDIKQMIYIFKKFKKKGQFLILVFDDRVIVIDKEKGDVVE